MALNFVAADVLWDTNPSVAYASGDWVIWLGIIVATAPPGTLTTMSLTSSGGGSMTVFNSSADSNYRYNLAYVQATSSGTSTFSYTTTGNVGTFFHRGALVIRGASYIEPVTFGFTSQSPSESGSTFSDTVTAGFGGLFACLAGRCAVDGDFSGYAGLTLTGVTPSDISDSALNQNATSRFHSAVSVAGDVGTNTSWQMDHAVSTPPHTPYATSRGFMQWAFGAIEEAGPNAYWGIDARLM